MSSSPSSSAPSAELYSNTIVTGCGHSIPWDPYQLVSLKKCPQCQESVSFVKSSSSLPPTDANSGNSISSSESHSTSQHVVLFRMGTNTFQLNVSPPTSGTASTPSTSKAPWWQTWWWSTGTTATSNPTANHQPNAWCLDQIAQQMKLHPQFKVLHKGTLLYPPKQGGQSNVVFNDVSQQLLDISQRDWKLLQEKRSSQQDAGGRGGGGGATSSSHSVKVSLVLMGTLQGEEIRGPPPSHQVSVPAGSTGIVGMGWWMYLYVSSWMQYGFSSIMGLCWMFFQSIVSPPETLSSDDTEGRSSVRRRRHDGGDHED